MDPAGAMSTLEPHRTLMVSYLLQPKDRTSMPANLHPAGLLPQED
jgi:hypothetical protein